MTFQSRHPSKCRSVLRFEPLEDRTAPAAGTPEPPIISFSTYLGGNGADFAKAVAVDRAGNVYVLGNTSSGNFPTTPGALQEASGGGRDAFVAKVNANGSPGYVTYLGGAGDETGYGIAVDETGNVYVTGQTNSADFPTVNALQQNPGGESAFLAKLNPTGTALVYSTYLGGAGYDAGMSVAVDGGGHAYVGGVTESNNFRTENPVQPARGGGVDAFVAKFDPTGTSLVYSTYLGGAAAEDECHLAIDGTGNAYAAGHTRSANFPTVNALYGSQPGGLDVFLTKLNPTGSALVYSTYVGGGVNPNSGQGLDLASGIAVDGGGAAYVTGYTNSPDFPTDNPIQATIGDSYHAYVFKMNAGGTALDYSTFLGGNEQDYGGAIAVDGDGNAFVVGETGSTNFPTVNPWQGPGGGGNGGFPTNNDAFVTKIKPDGTALVYSSFLGGSATETPLGVAVDADGNAFVVGKTGSVDFPRVAAWQTPAGGTDAFITRITEGGEPLTGSFPVRNGRTAQTYPTIAMALETAQDGDTILLADGVYREHLGIGKQVTLRADNPGGAILDGDGAGTLAMVSADVTFDGLHFRNAAVGVDQRDADVHYRVQRCIASDMNVAFSINNSNSSVGEADILNSIVLDSNQAVNINDGGTVRVTNTIIDNVRTAYVGIGVAIVPDHNLLHNVQEVQYGNVSDDPAQIVADPLFVDRISGNFHLGIGSPAIDSGIEVGEAYLGTGPDRGVFEFSASDNSSPLISVIADQTTNEGEPTGTIAFTVADAETVAESLVVTASSSNQELLPDANIVLNGSGASRTLTVTPAAGKFGTSTISVTVRDSDGGVVTTAFTLTVRPRSDLTEDQGLRT